MSVPGQNQNAASGAPVTEAITRSFRDKGVALVRGGLDAHWVAVLNAGVDRNIAHPGVRFRNFASPGQAACLTDDWAWEHIPEYQEFFSAPLAATAGELLGAQEIRFLEDNFFEKQAGSSTPSPWHHDQAYYEIWGEWIVAWVALDRIEKANGLEFVAGSHQWQQLYLPRSFGEGGTLKIPEAHPDLKTMPDISGHPDDYELLSWDVEPGDCLLFTPRTIHGNRGNSSGGRARRISMRYVTENCWYRKVFPWSSLIENHGLSAGDQVAGPKFPLLWTRRDGLCKR